MIPKRSLNPDIYNQVVTVDVCIIVDEKQTFGNLNTNLEGRSGTAGYGGGGLEASLIGKAIINNRKKRKEALQSLINVINNCEYGKYLAEQLSADLRDTSWVRINDVGIRYRSAFSSEDINTIAENYYEFSKADAVLIIMNGYSFSKSYDTLSISSQAKIIPKASKLKSYQRSISVEERESPTFYMTRIDNAIYSNEFHYEEKIPSASPENNWYFDHWIIEDGINSQLSLQRGAREIARSIALDLSGEQIR